MNEEINIPNPNLIKVTCQGAGFLSLDQFQILQGSLKDLSEENYLKLWHSIQEFGFNAPIFVWKDENSKNWVMDGTQRILTCRRKREEGWIIPPLPVAYINAENYSDAKRRLLNIVSQFGEITNQGFHDFFVDTNFNWQEVIDKLRMPEIDFGAFAIDFGPMTPVKDVKNSNKELDLNEFDNFEHTCPKCGFGWNSK